VEAGVAEGGRIRVDFAFTASNEEEAGDLADALLVAGYEAQAQAPDTELDAWTVRGTTVEAVLTRAGLDEWIRRMIAVGWQHDESSFDGWSAVLG
jgi:hypothetical protein